MIGFSLQESMDVVASLDVLGDNLYLIKDNTHRYTGQCLDSIVWDLHLVKDKFV